MVSSLQAPRVKFTLLLIWLCSELVAPVTFFNELMCSTSPPTILMSMSYSKEQRIICCLSSEAYVIICLYSLFLASSQLKQLRAIMAWKIYATQFQLRQAVTLLVIPQTTISQSTRLSFSDAQKFEVQHLQEKCV